MREEVATIKKNILRISEKNNSLEEEINRVTRKNLRMTQDSENLKEFIQNKNEQKNRLKESVKTHEQLELNLANQLLQCKSDLLDAQTFYQEFEVKVFHLLMKFKGKLIFKKNPDGEYVAELHYKGKKEVFFVSQIENICEHQTKENKIVLKYKDKTKEIFSLEGEKIVTRTRELMQRCMR